MQVAEIIKLKKELNSRLEVLRNELNLDEEAQALTEFDLFQSKSGWGQFFYYLLHYKRVRTAAEYSALKQLQKTTNELLQDRIQEDQLNLYQTANPELDISDDKKISLEYHKKVLHEKLLNYTRELDKNQAVNTFWLNFSESLAIGTLPQERVLAEFIKSTHVKPILFPKTSPDEGGTPSFLFLLPESGTREDVEALLKNTPAPKAPPVHEHFVHVKTSEIFPTATLPVNLKILNWSYSFTYMDDIQQRVQTLETTVKEAQQFQMQAEISILQKCRNFLYSIEKTINEWLRNPKIEVTKPSVRPTPAPATQATASSTATYFPSFSISNPFTSASTVETTVETTPAPTSDSTKTSWFGKLW